jgi:hypothetical protein
MLVKPNDKTGDRECCGIVAAAGNRCVGVMERGCTILLS